MLNPHQRLAVIAAVCMLVGSCMRSQSTYFVDPQGDDNSDGLSPASAWRTIAKVNATKLSAGDRVLFARGAVWYETLQPASSGTAARPLVFADFGAGAKPVLDAGGTLSGWSTIANWTYQSNGNWTISCARFPGRMWFVEASGPQKGVKREYGVSGTSDGHGSSTPTSAFRWYYASGKLFVWTGSGTQSPASFYTSIEIANAGRTAMSSLAGPT